jgi:hypothetical protein
VPRFHLTIGKVSVSLPSLIGCTRARTSGNEVIEKKSFSTAHHKGESQELKKMVSK